MKRTTFGFCLLGLWMLTGSAHAGDLERYCPIATGGNGVIERWANPSGVPWRIIYQVQGNALRFVPNYYPACGSFPPPVPTDVSGLRSIVRAANTWTNAQLPNVPGNASTFSLAAPSYVLQGSTDINPNDNINTLTCFMPLGQFTGAFAVTWVTTVTATGVIVDADIAVNCDGVSMLEEATDGITDSWFASSLTYTWCDLQGVVTHELGHLAGLGHSMIDGPASALTGVSSVPVMFPSAAPTDFHFLPGQMSVGTYTGDCSIPLGNSASVSSPLTIWGRDARTLALDDVRAIASGYPTAAFNNNASVYGRVATTSGTGVPGLSVVAVTMDGVHRASTLTYGNGEYSIRGLPPGDYVVYVESIDQPATYLPGTPGFYFDSDVVPNYTWLNTQTCGTFCGCIGASSPVIPTEFWNSAESGTEVLNQTATKLVLKLQSRAKAEFVVNSVPDTLRVIAADPVPAQGTWSARGLLFPANLGPVSLRITPPPALLALNYVPSAVCTVNFSAGRKANIEPQGVFVGQVREVVPAYQHWAGLTPSGPNAGTYVTSWPAWLLQDGNGFAQAELEFTHATLPPIHMLSNVVNVWPR